jgi:VanZ family protein
VSASPERVSPPPCASPSPQRTRWAGLCALTWVSACVVTHLPPAQLPDLHTSDLSLHAVGYGVLASVVWQTLRSYALSPARRWAWVLILLAYAVLDELTQPLMGRATELRDWLSDFVGIVSAFIGWELLAAWRAQRTTLQS